VLADVVGRDVAGRGLVFADGPGQVVVAVEQDRLREDFLRVVEGGICVSAGAGQQEGGDGEEA